jgi:hypothetical protein
MDSKARKTTCPNQTAKVRFPKACRISNGIPCARYTAKSERVVVDVIMESDAMKSNMKAEQIAAT